MYIERYIRLSEPIKTMTKHQLRVIFDEVHSIAHQIEDRMTELGILPKEIDQILGGK